MLLVRTCGANSKCFVLFDRHMQPVREAVSYRGLFTAGWFGVREKHCSRLKIYDRLQASEQAAYCCCDRASTIAVPFIRKICEIVMEVAYVISTSIFEALNYLILMQLCYILECSWCHTAINLYRYH